MPKKQRNDLVVVRVVAQMRQGPVVRQRSQLVKGVARQLCRQVMGSGLKSQAGENAVDSFSSRLVFGGLAQEIVAVSLAEINHGFVGVSQSRHGHVYEDGVTDRVQGDRIGRVRQPVEMYLVHLVQYGGLCDAIEAVLVAVDRSEHTVLL